MCGIAGILSFDTNRFRVTEPLLVGMRDTMIHRGPDGAGLWIARTGAVGLAHRRLSIIDLSTAASQPMSNEDSSIWIVFNGEIYNHADIRRELENLGGHQWRTHHSDTETIVHAYEQWGIRCLERFRGMFAFALWDGRSRELWLVRDRLGIKPLYYSLHNQRITFASEIKALFADPDQRREIDEEAFFHYLSFLTTPGPNTLYAGIRKLRPGTYLRVSAGGQVAEHRYWDVWDHTHPLAGVSESEIIEQLRAELRVAVKLRKISDVPVGVFLSGGIDSSTNAALFSEGETRAVKTFTIGYQGEHPGYRNETMYARRMAQRIGATYHEKLLDVDDLIDFLPTMVLLQDEPVADPVCVPLYYVSKLARENGCTVCQLGEGADELFCGYPAWQTSLKLQRYDRLPVPKGCKRAGLMALNLMGKGETFYSEWLRRAGHGQPIFWGGAEAFTDAQKRRLLHPDLARRLAGLTSWDAVAPIHKRFREAAWDKSDLNWMTYLDLGVRLPELLLMRVDKMSMGVSLEARVPFLDHKFVELVMSIPTAVKIGDGAPKYLLKKAVRGIIPDEFIDRKKQGFAVPIQDWFMGKLGDRAESELGRFCRDTGFLNGAEVKRLLDSPKSGSAWYLLNFALSWNHFLGPGRHLAAASS